MPTKTVQMIRAAAITFFGAPFLVHAGLLFGFYTRHQFATDPSLEQWLLMVVASLALGAIATFVLPFVLLMSGHFDER